jgi:alpha-methylacyl-CoA racemase
MLLADLGADVVRIDRAGAAPPLGVAVPPALDLLNRGKRSVALDLKCTEGQACALGIVAGSDALIEGFRPGVMERLGLGPEVCLARQPRLVYGRMTGWGQHGPLAPRAGHDIAYIALTGALHAIGRADSGPVPPINLLGDFAGGALYLALGILAAAIEAGRSGREQVVDAAIVDGTASLLTQVYALRAAGLWGDARGFNLLDTGCPWYDVYETSDGRHVAVGPLEGRFYDRFMALAGLAGNDVPGQWEIERWSELRARIASAIRTRTRDEWAAVFAGEDACVAPVLTLAEAPVHPHLAARSTFVEVAGTLQPAPSPRFSRTPGKVRHAPAVPGSHTRDILAEAGFTDDQIADWLARGVAEEAEGMQSAESVADRPDG